MKRKKTALRNNLSTQERFKNKFSLNRPMEKRSLIGIFIICSILLMGLASAGLIDTIKSAITGHATSQETNVTVSVAGTTQAKIISVSGIPAVTPLEATVTYVSFSAIMCDSDGVSDLNDSSVNANFSRTNEETRTNSSCILDGDLNGTCANYSCQVDMWYYAEAGTWNITVGGNDLGNLTPTYNDTTTFTFNQLKALVISPKAINWTSISPGAINQTADNDPTEINNTGNYNDTVAITGLDLFGETTTTEVFGTDNFTINLTTGAGNPECLGNTLVNNTATNVSSSASNRGNLSAGGGAGQENFYYCIPTVPSISSQQYSTAQAGGSWTVLYP